MKIEAIHVHHVAMPLKHAFETSFGRHENRHCLIIEVLAAGIEGWGECAADLHPGYSYETTGTALEIIAKELGPALLNLGDANPEEFQRAVADVKGHPMAKAGMEMALWDIRGKQQGLALAQMLGAKREAVEVGVSLGLEPDGPALLEKLEHYVAQGYSRVKLKIKPGRDIDVVRTARQVFPDLKLQVDANSAYSLEQALELKALEAFDLLMLEQPLAEDDLWDHSQLQRKMEIPICLDESILSARHARQAIEMGACQIINIKSGRVGGILEGKRIHDFCLEQQIPVWCGGMLETGVGRAANLALAGLPGFTLPGDISASERYYAEDITEEVFTLNVDGSINVPTQPGLGITVNRDQLTRYTLNNLSLPI